MSAHRTIHALFPGTFDPFTLGHLDLLARASRIFDRVTVAVASHPTKTGLFSPAERVSFIEEAAAGLERVGCIAITGLVVQACTELECDVIVRGARSGTDFDYETQMAHTNRELSGVETVILAPGATRTHISSTLVRQVASMGGDVSSFVPPGVLEALLKRFPKN